jgi:hypothetical protein
MAGSAMDDATVARSFATTVSLFVVGAAFALAVTVWRLRRYHPEAWQALAASPSGRLPAAVLAWRVIRFTLSPRHLGMADMTLSLACVAFLLGVLAVLVGFVGWMQSVLAGG